LPILATAEQDLSLKWEYVLMLGSPEVIAAGREWRGVGWHLEWFARGRIKGSEEYKNTEYEKTMQDYETAREKYYTAVRAELSIVSGEISLGDWPPPWYKDANDA
jgi:hypothetical protein